MTSKEYFLYGLETNNFVRTNIYLHDVTIIACIVRSTTVNKAIGFSETILVMSAGMLVRLGVKNCRVEVE